MKLKLVVLFIVLSQSLIAQESDPTKVRELFWGANDAYKNVTEINPKWNNESAVVIYKNVNYDYHKFAKRVTYTSSVRKRIKLLDKAAVEDYSEFSFNEKFWPRRGYYWKKGENIIGIKIIKPDGNEIIIDIDEEAVENDNEKKLAISNLEVGDILDYYSYRIEPFKSVGAYGFNPVETTLGDEYPIMNFELNFETENDFFVNFNSYNGAPELKEIKTNKRNLRRYKLEASDIEKNDFPRWFLPLVELPCYKFQVYFARSGKFEDRAVAFLPEKESIIKKTVSKEDVIDLYDSRFKPVGDISDIKKYFKSKNYSDPRQQVIEGYYYMRHFYMTRYIEAILAYESKIVYNPFADYNQNSLIYIQNQKQFVNHFTNFLKQIDITDYEIIIGTKKFNGDIKDLLIEDNVDVLLKINFDEPLYISYFKPNTSVNEFSPYLEGTNAYALQVSDKRKIDGIEDTKIIASDHTNNVTNESLNLSFNEDFSSVKISRLSKHLGHIKSEEQEDRLTLYDFVNEDHRKYETKSFIRTVRNQRMKTKYKKEMNALKEKYLDKFKERFKERTASEYSLELEDHSYKILSNGRFGVDDPLIFEESFTVKDGLVSKAGKNFIVNIGKLIGGQVEITDKNRLRENNIYMKYARTFNNEIVVEIPEGYTVAGLDKLNKRVENATGGFISNAILEGNKLTITTSKMYKKTYIPANQWNNVIAFLESAYNFSQEKILIKKL